MVACSYFLGGKKKVSNMEMLAFEAELQGGCICGSQAHQWSIIVIMSL